MTKLIKILCLVLLTGCSFMYRDKRPFSETSNTIEQAKRFRQDAPLAEQVKIAETLTFDRFCTGGILTTELRIENPSDLYGFSSEYVPVGFADASCYSRGALAGMALKYAWQVREYGEATTETLQHLDAAFEAVMTLCFASGVPGLLVRGCRLKDTPYNEKPHQEWHPGYGEHADKRCRYDVSTPQYFLTIGLQFMYALGPDKYKPRIREVMEDICLYLILHEYQIIDIDGLPTKISEFDPKDSLLVLGSPFTGYMGLYIVYAALPGGKTIYGVMTGNQAARRLHLLQILYFGAISTGNPLIQYEYSRLCKEGYAKSTVLAGVNFLGIFDAGDEIPKTELWLCLLWPEWRDALPDQEYQKYYWAGLERVYSWLEPMPTLATPIYCFLKGEKDEAKLARFAETLATFPLPYRRRPIVNSNNPNLPLYHWAKIGKSPEPLSAFSSILAHWQRKAKAWPRDPRSGLDSGGNGEREFSYIYLLYCYWFLKWSGQL